MLDQDHFADAAKKILPEIGGEHAVSVTRSQLAEAVLNPKFKGEETQALVAMYENFAILHNLSGHEGWLDTASITTGDLDKFQSLEKERAPLQYATTALKLWAHSDLPHFTSRGSEALTRADVDRALKDPATSKYDRDMLQMAAIIPGELDPAHFASGLSVKDFDQQYDQAWNDPTGNLVASVYGSCWDVVNDVQNPSTCHQLYSDRDPLKAITASGIKQGAIGDCYFEAVVASLAISDPILIRDTIADNHNNTFTVTFAGARGEPITVKAPTEAELSLYNRGSQYGEWASVIEKAYGQYRENHAWWNSNTPQEGADGGGQAGPVISLLTGRDSDNIEISDLSQAETAGRLQDAFAAAPARVVVAGIYNDFFASSSPSSARTADGFEKGHDYTVTSFTKSATGDGTVGLRNPHAGKDGTPDGTIQIPLAEFMRNFSDLSIQK